MRSSWTTRFSQGPHVSSRKLGQPVIVTEQQADPVELLHHAFRRLDADQRRRLLARIGAEAGREHRLRVLKED
jgi:hypothetical protein